MFASLLNCECCQGRHRSLLKMSTYSVSQQRLGILPCTVLLWPLFMYNLFETSSYFPLHLNILFTSADQWRITQTGKQILHAKAAVYWSNILFHVVSAHVTVLLYAIPSLGLLLLLPCLQDEWGCDWKLESSTVLLSPFYPPFPKSGSLFDANTFVFIYLNYSWIDHRKSVF